jgi:PAS domain S-box-containing protein
MAKHALVVDNDRLYVELVGDLLAEAGYAVAKAYDGMEALEVIERDRPDLVILDIVMPKIEGDRVCRYLKASPGLCEIPVVVLSGTLTEDREKVLALGADAYVAKGPIEDLRRNLLAALHRLAGDPAAAARTVLGLEGMSSREQVKELLALKRHKEAILRTVGEGVIEVDNSQRVVYVNPAGLTLLGRPELDLIGAPVAELLGPDHRGTLAQALGGLMASPQRTEEALSLRVRDRVLRVTCTLIAPDEPESGLFLILQDITDLAKKIEELSTLTTRLQELERTRSEFMAMVSHDLHTPLTAIKGSLDVLLHEGVGADLSRELMGIAQKNADRLFRMVSDILDMARIEAGRFEIHREPFDVVSGLQSTVDRMQRLIQDRRIELTLQADEGLPLVRADGLRMDQVFTNLLSNALKFTPPGGKVVLSVRGLSDDILVQMRDSGLGIPGEYLGRIFDRFYRVPLPPGEKVEGSGLGLSICKSIVEEHGGRIWAESVPGQGSTFSFTLPKTEPEP